MTETNTKQTNGADSSDIYSLQNDLNLEVNKRGVANHIKAAEHFSLASKFHLEAARYHEEGSHEKANQSALFAYGHSLIADECQAHDVKHHSCEHLQ